LPAKRPDVAIRTTIVSGDYESYKAALSRSLIGVTMKKFKKLGGKFFQTKSYNVAIVDELCKKCYEELQSKLQDVPLKFLRVTTALNINWDNEGRIVRLSDMKLTVYYQIGELEVAAPVIRGATRSIKVDFFYSQTDFASQTVKKILDELIGETGSQFFERNDYDLLAPQTKKIAEAHNVRFTPTVILNQEVLLENPTRNALQERITAEVAPSVTLKESKYTMEASLPIVSEKLQTIVRK
jgi:hypothetical protein